MEWNARVKWYYMQKIFQCCRGAFFFFRMKTFFFASVNVQCESSIPFDFPRDGVTVTLHAAFAIVFLCQILLPNWGTNGLQMSEATENHFPKLLNDMEGIVVANVIHIPCRRRPLNIYQRPISGSGIFDWSFNSVIAHSPVQVIALENYMLICMWFILHRIRRTSEFLGIFSFGGWGKQKRLKSEKRWHCTALKIEEKCSMATARSLNIHMDYNIRFASAGCVCMCNIVLWIFNTATVAR